MAEKIRTTTAVNGLLKALKKAEKFANDGRLRIGRIDDPKLYEIAAKVAGRQRVAGACGQVEYETKPVVDLAKLTKSVKAVAQELKKADKNKDSYLTPAEGKNLSALAKRVLGAAIQEVEDRRPPRRTNPDVEPISTSCGGTGGAPAPRRPSSSGNANWTPWSPSPRPVGTGC